MLRARRWLIAAKITTSQHDAHYSLYWFAGVLSQFPLLCLSAFFLNPNCVNLSDLNWRHCICIFHIWVICIKPASCGIASQRSWEILSCFDLTGADFKCQMQKYNQILYNIMSVWFSVNPSHRSKSNITIAATALDHHHHNVRMKVQKMWVLHLPRRTV